MIPAPWIAIVMTLWVYRVVRLIGWDDMPLISRLRRWAVGETSHYNPTENRDHAVIRYRRPTLNHFLNCPFCQGFWVSLAAYGTWVAVGSPGAIPTESWTFYVSAPFALSAAVGLLTKTLDA